MTTKTIPSADLPNDLKSVRDLDPNVLQRRAADPQSSIWVSASAGTGKTKVLTDRMLRLLLPREDGTSGAAPHKILGLTFTKAGAGEMALRISQTLSTWAVMPQSELQNALKNLLGRAANTSETTAARRLFAQVIDTPGRLKIMTIHAFCQSVLARFPLESGLVPGFEITEERASFDLITAAQKQALTHATQQEQSDKTAPLYAAFSTIAATITEDQFAALIRAIARERHQFETLKNRQFGVAGMYETLCAALDIPPAQTGGDILKTACRNASCDAASLKSAAAIMAASDKKTDQDNAAKIAAFLTATENDRPQHFQTYASAFLTQKNEIKKTLCTKAIGDKHPHIAQTLEEEANRLSALQDTIKAANMAALTRDLLLCAEAILAVYDDLKRRRNMLDYEDLIIKTLHLLHTSSDWVQFKLDEGIEHILIDEAQDTNPEQWQIIEALCTEFFAAHSHDDRARTVFTVGDEKQSIYSFQRASPEDFARMQTHFADKITGAQKRYSRVDLNISFRSTKSVLAAVDAVFARPDAQNGLGEAAISHHAFRRGAGGLVEIWPLCQSDEPAVTQTWDPPVFIEDYKSGATKCAEHIADTLQRWFETGETLPSKNRAIRPGDIMILLRTRGAFAAQIARALKTRNIPVGGLDRMVLNDQIAVQDLLAAAEFALLPSDDLTLACLLKSPLIGMDENSLFTLAYDRSGTLWTQIKSAPQHQNTAAYLGTLITAARAASPFEFFAKILQTPCPADPVSGRRAITARLGRDALEPCEELLNAAFDFERSHTAALQTFLHWQRAAKTDIKREHEDNANHVRIMTVHGSKGLQAPIVILPDTTGMPGGAANKADSRLLWPSASDAQAPLWAPRKDMESDAYTKAAENVKNRLRQEYRRLLYVAMTRAEDRLYITGYQGKREPDEGCWYNLMRRGLETHPKIEHIGEDIGEHILRLSNPQTKEIAPSQTQTDESYNKTEIPAWLFQPAPVEPHPPAPLVPSRPSNDEPAALSPLKAAHNQRFRRGNVTHTLLQFLPDLPSEARKAAAESYLSRHAADLDDAMRSNILQETLNILSHPDFAAIFAPPSRAEVPITGLLKDGRLVSGQIDRLLITQHEILIVDYKTNRPPPQHAKDIPAVYRRQMETYAAILQAMYPGRTVKCALLWTDGPNLMPLDATENKNI
ncbi:MAG: double-strand break repair helicase AddA [Bdellovibrionales bacterium]